MSGYSPGRALIGIYRESGSLNQPIGPTDHLTVADRDSSFSMYGYTYQSDTSRGGLGSSQLPKSARLRVLEEKISKEWPGYRVTSELSELDSGPQFRAADAYEAPGVWVVPAQVSAVSSPSMTSACATHGSWCRTISMNARVTVGSNSIPARPLMYSTMESGSHATR